MSDIDLSPAAIHDFLTRAGGIDEPIVHFIIYNIHFFNYDILHFLINHFLSIASIKGI